MVVLQGAIKYFPDFDDYQVYASELTRYPTMNKMPVLRWLALEMKVNIQFYELRENFGSRHDMERVKEEFEKIKEEQRVPIVCGK